LRAEAYAFGAFGRIVSDELNQPVYNHSWHPYLMGSTSLVYHSPLGPVSLAVNYYDQQDDPWSVLFNFGLILFNRSVRD
jgi:NTE family protein